MALVTGRTLEKLLQRMFSVDYATLGTENALILVYLMLYYRVFIWCLIFGCRYCQEIGYGSLIQSGVAGTNDRRLQDRTLRPERGT